jgi:hypothetical protein
MKQRQSPDAWLHDRFSYKSSRTEEQGEAMLTSNNKEVIKVDLNHRQIKFVVCLVYTAYALMIQEQQVNKNHNRRSITLAANIMNRLSDIASTLGDGTCTVSFSEPEHRLIVYTLLQMNPEGAGINPASEAAQTFEIVKGKLLGPLEN